MSTVSSQVFMAIGSLDRNGRSWNCRFGLREEIGVGCGVWYVCVWRGSSGVRGEYFRWKAEYACVLGYGIVKIYGGAFFR